MGWLWEKLGGLPFEEVEGLQLSMQDCWFISARKWDAVKCFSSLQFLAGCESVLYLEGGMHSPEVSRFFQAHAIAPVDKIYPGTLWPRQQVYHLPATEDVFQGLAQLADHHASPEICDHLVIYRPSQVLVDWYDAFSRDIFASTTIPEHDIRRFAAATVASYRRE